MTVTSAREHIAEAAFGDAVGEYQEACDGNDHGTSIRQVLDRVGDKWSLLVVGSLMGRSLRFTELQRTIPGISQRMLTLTLRHLERDGLIIRTAYAEVPPRVEYALTDLGITLCEPVMALAHWAMVNIGAIDASRATYDARLGESGSATRK